MPEEPNRRGLAWLLAAKAVCCGGLLLAATGALSLGGLAGWRVDSGIVWLERRDQGCCFPGCTAHRHVDAHHIHYWADGGETKLDNLVLLCRLCRARHKRHYADSRIMPTGLR